MDEAYLLQVFVILMLVPSYLSWTHPRKLDYETHPCKRDCLATSFQQMTCEYDFILEHYQTLSRACYDCPHNITDCDRPHCVTGDGFLRAIKVVNRMLPGPGIHVCKGDTIVVNVDNQLMDFEGTSIHWHGILQEGTPHMDGVAMVTQCPIPVHSSFQYKFQVQQTGTHFWHSHSGMQRGDGIHGALIVRDTMETEVMSSYDVDLPEHTIFVQDWLDQLTASKYSLHHHGMAENTPCSILINGKGTKFGQASDGGMHGGHDMEGMAGMMGDMGDMDGMEDEEEEEMDDDEMVYTPHAVFKVRKGLRYRLRFINNGIVNCPLKVSIVDHTLTIIASDGADIKPVTVESLNIFAGERYDVVLNANQDIGNYWMHVIGLGDCSSVKISQTAIIRYDGAMNMKPMSGDTYEDGDRQGTNANPLTFSDNTITVGQMTSHDSPDDIFTAHNVKKFYMSLGYNKVENYRYLDPEHYPLSVMYEKHKDMGMHASHLFALQINKITHAMPDMPVLTQYAEADESIFCNETSPPRDCSVEFCECVHRLKVDLDDVVELVLVSDGKHGLGFHPMHLHGYSFYVLGMQKLNDTVDRTLVEFLDSKGRLRRNLVNPVKKDTVVVPDGGYTIIRFKASNPGFWLFHCHVEFHIHLGLSMVIQVGESHQMTKAPRNFPRCGSWKFTADDTSPAYGACALQSSASGVPTSANTVLFWTICVANLVLAFMFSADNHWHIDAF